MTRKTWVLVIASILVSVILIEGQVFATDEEERKKIVMFQEGTTCGSAADGGEAKWEYSGTYYCHSSMHWQLSFPMRQPDEAVAFLLNYTVLGIRPVVGVYDDLVVSVLPITPALPGMPLQERYDWGLKHIGVDVAHEEMPTLTGAGVKVAVVDTGIACRAS